MRSLLSGSHCLLKNLAWMPGSQLCAKIFTKQKLCLTDGLRRTTLPLVRRRDYSEYSRSPQNYCHACSRSSHSRLRSSGRRVRIDQRSFLFSDCKGWVFAEPRAKSKQHATRKSYPRADGQSGTDWNTATSACGENEEFGHRSASGRLWAFRFAPSIGRHFCTGR
jgi:hypothetical protein